MKIDNKKRAIKLKRVFFQTSSIIAISALLLFIFDFPYMGLACIGVFSLWLVYFLVADYLFVEFSDENGKILLRYYKVLRLGKGEFSSIEFPKEVLHKAYFENSIFGKMADLTLEIKTKRGIAEYPTISLSAVSLLDRRKIKTALIEIIGA